jgi:hypothetical protein
MLECSSTPVAPCAAAAAAAATLQVLERPQLQAGSSCLHRMLHIAAPTSTSSRPVEYRAGVQFGGDNQLFSLKIAAQVMPCSSSSSSSFARLELASTAAAAAGKALGAAAAGVCGSFPAALQSGECLDGLLALRFYDQYGNLQTNTAQQQAFASAFPDITAAAVGRDLGIGFLLLQQGAAAAAAAGTVLLSALPSSAFSWSEGAGSVKPGYLLRGAALVARLPPEHAAGGVSFVISVHKQHGLSGVLLPGQLQQFCLESTDIIAGRRQGSWTAAS